MAKRALPVNGVAGRSRNQDGIKRGPEMSKRAESGRGRALRGRAGRMQGGRGSGRASQGAVRLWGRHAVEAALKNPERQHRKLWATREGVASLDGELPADFPVEYAQAADLARLVARDAPHQGLVLECEPLPELWLDDVLDGNPARPVLVLDQVTDPHNVGAILRSAAAFDACALVTQDPTPRLPRACWPSRHPGPWKSCRGCGW